MLMKTISNKLFSHKRDLLTVTVGQVIAALGSLFGVRLLTEFISIRVWAIQAFTCRHIIGRRHIHPSIHTIFNA